MNDFKLPTGGRGNAAPYSTTHYRIPIAIKPIVQNLSNEYKRLVMEGDTNPVTKIEAMVNTEVKPMLSLEETLELVKQLLAQKKSAKVTLVKLVSTLYDVEIDPKKL